MKCGTGDLNTGVRLTRKTQNENERKLIQSWWKELTRMYGTYIDYYTYDYSLTAQDFFYGEHTLAPYTGPKGMLMLSQFNNDSLLLSKFGIRTDADATFIVPIQTFRESYGSNAAEPKSGDLIRMTELGWDRPGGMDDLNTISVSGALTGCDQIVNPLDQLCRDGIVDTTGPVDCNTDTNAYSGYNDQVTFEQLVRGAPIFEITERRDENLTMQYNLLQGHYVWILHAKRFDYSYQPNAPREPGMDQVSDETLYGKLSGGTDYPEAPKKYEDNIEDTADQNWDYSRTPNSNSNVYGGY